MAVRDWTLWRSGDIVALRCIRWKQVVLEVLDHSRVSACHIIVLRRWVHEVFDIEIKAIYACIAPWPGNATLCRRRRPKRGPQEICKLLPGGVALDIVIRRLSTTKRKKYFLSICLLARNHVGSNVRARLQQTRIHAIMLIVISPARVSKVCARPTSRALIRKHVHETDIYYVIRGILAGREESVLVRALAPVCYDIGLGGGIEYGERERGKESRGGEKCKDERAHWDQ